MSDFISREETIKALRNYAEQKHYGGETVLANGILKAVCFIEKEENIKTLDETEIIRKAFERVVERLEEKKEYHRKKWNINFEDEDYDSLFAYTEAIKIVKEECGINE